MPYRDELAALTLELEQKHVALIATRARRGQAEDEEQALAGEVAALTAKVTSARRRLSLLGQVEVATPCDERWDTMVGDERSRFCGRCRKHVYNLSGMTAVEAERFVVGTAGEACVRFFRRPDGTILTEDCAVGVRRKRLRTLRNVVVGGVVLGGAGTVGLGLFGMATMGAMRPIHAGSVGRAQEQLMARTQVAWAETQPAAPSSSSAEAPSAAPASSAGLAVPSASAAAPKSAQSDAISKGSPSAGGPRRAP